jgi:maltodextrin utilization protein YvdJ
MKQKSKAASISDRLSLIESTNGFEAASRFVAERCLDVPQQKEAESWLLKRWVARNWVKVLVTSIGVVSGVVTVVKFLLA